MPSLIGHQDIIENFKALARSGNLGHGYILFGPSMVGKRTVAAAFAAFLEGKDFVAVSGHGILQDSKAIDRAYMKMLDPDTKDSIGIDAIREVKDFLWQKPAVSARRTLIIDDAELLTTEAQNALLKVTEEPPVSSLLIIITSDIEGLLPTIASRLPKIYFGPIAGGDVERWLVEDHGLAKAKASTLAARSFGKPGLAVRLMADKAFEKSLSLAEKLLKTPKAGRRDVIKKIIEPDDFNLRKFLDAVIMVVAWEKPSKAKTALWHKTLRLYGNANDFGLNPRIQLENLLAEIK
jgi:DNA polymerase-3 subunit delta'